MKKAELAHILRAASEITGDPKILVLGSQSILGSYDEERLPAGATFSIEADVAFIEDPGEHKMDRVDGGIGEASSFHETFGVYAQGVTLDTAVLPDGWQDRLIAFEDPEAGASKAVCLEPHDLVVSKLVAGREKDRTFARALLDAGLVELKVLCERAELLSVLPPIKRRVIDSLGCSRV